MATRLTLHEKLRSGRSGEEVLVLEHEILGADHEQEVRVDAEFEDAAVAVWAGDVDLGDLLGDWDVDVAHVGALAHLAAQGEG